MWVHVFFFNFESTNEEFQNTSEQSEASKKKKRSIEIFMFIKLKISLSSRFLMTQPLVHNIIYKTLSSFGGL